jgi:hypothetical protein
MPTFVYVDGYNLYYGSLKGTAYRWLDLKALLAGLLGSDYRILSIKYYTAILSARDGDPDEPTRQMIYLNALKAHIPQIYIKKDVFCRK